MTNRPRTRDVLKTCRVLARDKQGRVTKVEVPGSTGDIYHIIIRRYCGPSRIVGYPSHFAVECFKANELGNIMCEAAIHRHVCKHARQALIVAAMFAPEPSYLKFYKVRPNHGSLANIGKHAIAIRIKDDDRMREWIIRRVI